jgi:hypothetical protein
LDGDRIVPPNIVDIILKAAGDFGGWISSTADIVLRATPDFGVAIGIGGILFFLFLVGTFFYIQEGM